MSSFKDGAVNVKNNNPGLRRFTQAPFFLKLLADPLLKISRILKINLTLNYYWSNFIE